MTHSMNDRVALITGGSSGIGKATALAFAAEGARVAIASRGQKRGVDTVHAIRASGAEATWIQADMSDAAQVEEMVDRVIDAYGRLDYAFNNAGSGGKGAWIPEIEEDDWDRTIDGYLKSVWLCMKYEIPQMLKVGGGAIVNSSSVDGRRAFPWDPAYSAAKHGVVGLTRSAAVQYADKGIRINAVCPGWIRTPPVEDALERDSGAESRMLSHQPIGRFGRPDEVAQAVVWLCSDKASLVIGTAMPIDGGYLAV